MNQTNFGYNPARNTLVPGGSGIGADIISFDSINAQRADRQFLNTQKRNRTSTIEATPMTTSSN
jgi:hypothetical protein